MCKHYTILYKGPQHPQVWYLRRSWNRSPTGTEGRPCLWEPMCIHVHPCTSAHLCIPVHTCVYPYTSAYTCAHLCSFSRIGQRGRPGQRFPRTQDSESCLQTKCQCKWSFLFAPVWEPQTRFTGPAPLVYSHTAWTADPGAAGLWATLPAPLEMPARTPKCPLHSSHKEGSDVGFPRDVLLQTVVSGVQAHVARLWTRPSPVLGRPNPSMQPVDSVLAGATCGLLPPRASASVSCKGEPGALVPSSAGGRSDPGLEAAWVWAQLGPRTCCWAELVRLWSQGGSARCEVWAQGPGAGLWTPQSSPSSPGWARLCAGGTSGDTGSQRGTEERRRAHVAGLAAHSSSSRNPRGVRGG